MPLVGNGANLKGRGANLEGNGANLEGNGENLKGNGENLEGNGANLEGNGVLQGRGFSPRQLPIVLHLPEPSDGFPGGNTEPLGRNGTRWKTATCALEALSQAHKHYGSATEEQGG